MTQSSTVDGYQRQNSREQGYGQGREQKQAQSQIQRQEYDYRSQGDQYSSRQQDQSYYKQDSYSSQEQQRHQQQYQSPQKYQQQQQSYNSNNDYYQNQTAGQNHGYQGQQGRAQNAHSRPEMVQVELSTMGNGPRDGEASEDRQHQAVQIDAKDGAKKEKKGSVCCIVM
ncbi:hypothetical protein BGZ97_002777 [Linnemannia gamsii]|uniref:Uncharacterized protein n=1 Tax=Linnemannia gamsii TaxID=64522 RepID=A0A9P6UI52_9FUNG|nr:hypothetical protein BGZ97_002777 [Linnemannia gamsii]